MAVTKSNNSVNVDTCKDSQFVHLRSLEMRIREKKSANQLVRKLWCLYRLACVAESNSRLAWPCQVMPEYLRVKMVGLARFISNQKGEISIDRFHCHNNKNKSKTIQWINREIVML